MSELRIAISAGFLAFVAVCAIVCAIAECRENRRK